MSADMSRSEQVVEDYKKHKLVSSALSRIHKLIRGFEEGRSLDLRLALFGSIIILVLIGVTAYFLQNTHTLTLF